MKKAWIENAVIRDVAQGNPGELFHPDIAAFFDTDVPDDAANGDGWVNGELIKPELVIAPPPEIPPALPAKVSPVEFMLLFTSPERVAIKALRQTNPIIDDFLDIIEDPRLTFVDLGLGSTVSAIDYLIYVGLVAPERKAEILTGVML